MPRDNVASQKEPNRANPSAFLVIPLFVSALFTRQCAHYPKLFTQGADGLEEYELTGPEKLALLTADINWIEEHIGPLIGASRNNLSKWTKVF